MVKYALCIAMTALIGSFLLQGHSAIDIQLYDTYYVIYHQDLSLMASLLFAFYGLLYWLIGKTGVQLRAPIAKLHLMGSALVLATILVGGVIMNQQQEVLNPEAYRNAFRKINTWVSLMLLLFLAFQALLPINFMVSFFKRQ